MFGEGFDVSGATFPLVFRYPLRAADSFTGFQTKTLVQALMQVGYLPPLEQPGLSLWRGPVPREITTRFVLDLDEYSEQRANDLGK